MEYETFIKLSFQLIALLIAIIAFLKGLSEYKKKIQLDKVNIYLKLRDKFKETKNFSLIIEYLDSLNPKLSEVSKADRLKFLGFLEEVALINNSGLLDDKVMNQSFGYYVIRAFEHPDMWWEGNQPDSKYRVLLVSMKNICEKSLMNKNYTLPETYKF